MIDSSEASARARKLRLSAEHIERDYVLNCVLASIAESRSELVFRGGTALARVYWPDFRLSEDLDFIAGGTWSAIAETLDRAVASASRLASIQLEFQLGKPRRGWSRSYVRFSGGEILVDVSLGERAFLPIEDRVLHLPYSDLQDRERRISVVGIGEIMGNKWFMIGDDERKEPRDLYDVWAGLCKFEVAFSVLARGHRAKYGFGPNEDQLRRAQRLRPLWETRLAHQLADLPPFEAVYVAIQQRYKDWRASETSRRSPT